MRYQRDLAIAKILSRAEHERSFSHMQWALSLLRDGWAPSPEEFEQAVFN